MNLYVFIGILVITPVTGFGLPKTFREAGRVIFDVKGAATLWVVTPVCVPPRAVTATCFPGFWGGAVSVTTVYVGLVKPVCAAPVIGDVIAILKVISSIG
jgi:hypothetical protein